MHRTRAGVIAAGCALLGLTGLVAGVASTGGAVAAARPAVARLTAIRAGRSAPAGRDNVQNTHSPELERLLAGPESPAARPLRAGSRAATSAAPAIAGAKLPPGASAVQGVDVASFQHPGGAPIDWPAVAAAGYSFAFVKATEGDYYVNPYAAGDVAAARSAGMYVAPYHFGIPNASGAALQADYAVDHSAYTLDGRTLPLILDIEYDPYVSTDHTNTCYGLTPAQMVSWVAVFTAEAARRTGQYPVIYTTAQWWNECTKDSTAFGADPLWIAGYTSSGPPMPAAWTAWTYWQYTSAASVPGIGSRVDASYLNAAALQLLDPPAQSQAAGSVVSLQLGSLTALPGVSYGASGLPPGLAIAAASGLISGTLPASSGAFAVTVSATPPAGPAVTRSLHWYVHGRATLGHVVSQRGTVGSPVLVRVPVRDDLPGCTLRLSASGLPPGLTMSSCGLISGWAQATGQYHVRVQATDSTGAVLASASFGFAVGRGGGSGPVGLLRLAGGRRCLERLGKGGSVATGRCTSPRAARWTIAADGTMRLRHSCLAQSASGPGLVLVSCSRSVVPHFHAGPSGEVISTTAGTCVTSTGSRSGALAAARACTGGSGQRWQWPAGPITSGIPGSCLSDRHRHGPVLGPVSLQRCNGSAQQAWTIEPDGTIRAGGGCLGLANGSTAYGTAVILGNCRQLASQVWQVSGGPFGTWLVNSLSSMCLSDPGDRSRAGTGLALGLCQVSDPGISWRLH